MHIRFYIQSGGWKLDKAPQINITSSAAVSNVKLDQRCKSSLFSP